MIIEQIDLYHVRMPLLEPWVTAYGSQNDIESLFVKIISDGISGWGECAPSPLPLYNSEFSAGAFVVARDIIAPRLIGRKVISGEFLHEILSDLKGHQFAKSAFDGAWWDAHSQHHKTPLWALIGGTKECVQVGADIPVLTSTDELLNRVKTSMKGGFPRIKLKFNRQCTVDMIKQVRDAFPQLIMHIDCNSGFTLDDIAMFQELDKFDLKMIEQPLSYDDLVDHAELRKTIQTPICLDESITSLHRAKKAIKIGACDWINIKTSRVGGLTNGIAIHDFCEANGVPVWIGGMLESAVGQGPSLALATKSNVNYPSDIFPSDRFFAQDFSYPDICISAPGEITAPSSNGIGFAPKMNFLKNYSVAKASIMAQ